MSTQILSVVRRPSTAVEMNPAEIEARTRPSSQHNRLLIRMLATTLMLWVASCALAEEDLAVEFTRDVRPILSENCFHCHGPDAEQREAELRLDQRDDLYGDGTDEAIITPGQPQKSELWRRVTATDDDERMPPTESGKQLTDEQLRTLRRWIEQGAAWQSHWSFTALGRPKFPPLAPHQADATWPRNGIDRFVLARLHERQLRPAPEADQQTLIRRVSLDLTGLPPTPEEVDRFLSDEAEDAYERLVDRLLESPRYGERMAAVWLDAARYADSYGYQDDGEVSMWRWRDWVITAFNENMPFDQFTVEQLAGDLLPDATVEQRIATGFNRNHRANSEGGSIPEEFRVEYVADRVDTTATVWLGMTMVCARCHDHKYDPVSQREFYQLFAFFNNVNEDGRARKNGNTPPLMPAPTRAEQQAQLDLERQLEAARHELEQLEPQIMRAQRAWEQNAPNESPNEYTVTRALERRIRFDKQDEILSTAPGPDEVAVLGGEPEFCRGQVGDAFVFDGRRHVETDKDAGHFSDDDKFSLALWVRPTRDTGGILSHLEEPNNPKSKGYNLLLQAGRLRLTLVQQWFDDAIRVETKNALPLNRWSHIAVSYDASRLARGVRIYVNGAEQPLTVELDSLFQGFSADQPVKIGVSGDPTQRFHGAIDDVRIYEDVLTPEEVRLLVTLESIEELLELSPTERSPNQQQKLRSYFLTRHAPRRMNEANKQVRSLQRELDELVESFPTVMIMEECDQRRPTHLLIRGRYDALGDEVVPDVPSFLPPLPSGSDRNRLDLARWLVSPEHPLTARVTANRLWQMSFGVGLVKTSEDFGSQGSPPSHPQLLDWLGTELMRTGWDLKAIRRLMVTSATYRQSSRATPALWADDPENRLLAHGPRFRLPAEMIRDQALMTSGLLVEQLGGRSVRPYQPAKLWAEVSDDEYEQDHGTDLYRRSLYTFWKRTIPHPAMKALDAVDREICAVREGRTNTPLQALTLMNEQGFVEAARVLAERVLGEAELDTRQKLIRAFRLATGRAPGDAELTLLLDGLDRHRAHYARHPDAAKELVEIGEHHRRENTDAAELAAFTTVANMLLNLDETLTQH